MDLAPLISRIDKSLPGAILERQKFGRTSIPCIWIEAAKIRDICAQLREDREASLTWLENIGAVQIDAAVVLSYFVRSTRSRAEIVLRLAIEPKGPNIPIEVPTVREVWPMATSIEAELGELFGIRFGDEEIRSSVKVSNVSDFPLRKGAGWLNL